MVNVPLVTPPVGPLSEIGMPRSSDAVPLPELASPVVAS